MWFITQSYESSQIKQTSQNVQSLATAELSENCYRASVQFQRASRRKVGRRTLLAQQLHIAYLISDPQKRPTLLSCDYDQS